MGRGTAEGFEAGAQGRPDATGSPERRHYSSIGEALHRTPHDVQTASGGQPRKDTHSLACRDVVKDIDVVPETTRHARLKPRPVAARWERDSL